MPNKIAHALLSGLLLCCFTLTALAKPLVIAHRGASGYLPEHTLAAASLAYAQGADFIEQDLVLSKDGVPVVLHDIHLERVTDVATRFPQRKRKDGRYYVIDFSLAELKQLRVHERRNQDGSMVFPNRYREDGDFRIATFEEQIRLINEMNRMFGRNVGLYAEIKSPAWHRSQGADISQIVLEVLRKHDLDHAAAKIFIQCFDFKETKRWRNELSAKVKLVQLIGENDWMESSSDYDFLKSAEGLVEIAAVAQGIGPWIPQLVDLETLQPTSLVMQAKKAGLVVHPYTYRNDQLPPGVTESQTMDLLFKVLNVDGVFTDFTDTVVDYLAQ